MRGKPQFLHLLPSELAELVFEWPVRQGPRLALPLCILAAALIQFCVVLLFSIRYPAPSAAPTPPPPVVFLPRDSDLARNLEPWLEANDPAVFSPIRAARESVPELPPLAYKPSYLDPLPPLHPLPATVEKPVEPPLLPPEGLQRSSEQRLRHKTGEGGPGVAWMDGLQSRLTGGEGFPGTVKASRAALRPLLLEAGFDEQGQAVHCVVLESSGDEVADETAKAWLLSRKLSPGRSSSWGRVLVRWGEDAPASPTPIPSQP